MSNDMIIPDAVFSRIKGSCADAFGRHVVSVDSTLFDALTALNSLSGNSMTLFATAADGRVAGTLTDGDVRRALLGGLTLDSSVASAMNPDFLALRPGDDPSAVFAEARDRGIKLIPELSDGFVVSLIDLRVCKAILPIDAVLMAGGRGERLRPLTLEKPKPLLPIGGKPIIDYNIEELRANGVDSIFVTVNYLKEQIQAHFEGVGGVRCVAENAPLGTIGSLALVRPMLSHDNVLLMNSDLLTSLSFDSLYRHHVGTGSDLTIAAVPYTVSVPYAILSFDGDRVSALEEKPTYNYLANGGVYIMRRELIDRIPEGERLDAPDFIASLIADGLKVTAFPIDGTWIDIGSPDDYAYADRLMSRPAK